MATPGAQQAISRSEPVTVEVGDTVGAVRRPNMAGALVVKAAAYSVRNDPARRRHLIDLAVLAAMARGTERLGTQLTDRDRRYLTQALSALRNARGLWAAIDGADVASTRSLHSSHRRLRANWHTNRAASTCDVSPEAISRYAKTAVQ